MNKSRIWFTGMLLFLWSTTTYAPHYGNWPNENGTPIEFSLPGSDESKFAPESLSSSELDDEISSLGTSGADQDRRTLLETEQKSRGKNR